MVKEYFDDQIRPAVPPRVEQATSRMQIVELVMTETDVLKSYNVVMTLAELWDEWNERASAWKRDQLSVSRTGPRC